jgi:hypothetical protein
MLSDAFFLHYEKLFVENKPQNRAGAKQQNPTFFTRGIEKPVSVMRLSPVPVEGPVATIEREVAAFLHASCLAFCLSLGSGLT